MPAPGGHLTSKVIHDIGSSSGISVFLTSFSSNFSSSNWTVKMAPGGVHVPIIKWWRGILDGGGRWRTVTSASAAGQATKKGVHFGCSALDLLAGRAVGDTGWSVEDITKVKVEACPG